MEKDVPNKGNWGQTWIEILISDEIDFKLKVTRRDRWGHFVFIKGKTFK